MTEIPQFLLKEMNEKIIEEDLTSIQKIDIKIDFSENIGLEIPENSILKKIISLR